MKKKGFTLIELVVVMAIIAVLSLIIIAAIQAARRSSIEAQNRGNARTIEVALESVAAKNNGSYCGTSAANPATGLPACNANQTLASLASWLSQNPSGNPILTSNITGTCATGGGNINLTSSSFTIYVSKADGASCTTAATATDNLQIIRH